MGREKIILTLGIIPDFFDASVCIPRDVAHRNQDMTTHGELREKFDVVSREEVFGVREKKTSLERHIEVIVDGLEDVVVTVGHHVGVQWSTFLLERRESLGEDGAVISKMSGFTPH